MIASNISVVDEKANRSCTYSILFSEKFFVAEDDMFVSVGNQLSVLYDAFN